MKISPINFGKIHSQSIDYNESVPTTQRHNSLADMEFSIIADTIRSQNLKNQMNVRLMNLKRNLNSYMAQELYQHNSDNSI